MGAGIEAGSEKMALVLSPQQEAIIEVCRREACHLVIKALAGTGKTTTIVEALKVLPRGQKVAFVCFNKTIAMHLQTKVPPGVTAATLHSLGGRALSTHLRRPLRDLVDKDKVLKMLPPGAAPHVKSAVIKLVSLCKNMLTDPTNENLADLADAYGIELENSGKACFNLTRKYLNKSKSELGTIDFDDMIYLPVVLHLPIEKYDVMFVDEMQDLNGAQQRLILLAGARIVGVGDEHQAIYRFRGADAHSMENMERMLRETGRETKVLPLTVTRRCPPTVVELAQSIVPEFECLPEAWAAYRGWKETNTNGEVPPAEYGTIVHASRREYERGQLVLCRTNAPLITEAYSLIKQNIPVKVQGRSIGQDLAKLIKKLAAPQDTVVDLSAALDAWRAKEVARLTADEAKAISNEAKLQILGDKCDCIEALCEGMDTVQQVLDRINVIFADVEVGTDYSKFVLMSSVHRAKGLEANVVQIIEPGLMPHPMATKDEEIVQEYNLKYVAITRAIRELHFR
jgi:DNA helicase II / ATP-dependent DNA helicase PcrA